MFLNLSLPWKRYSEIPVIIIIYVINLCNRVLFNDVDVVLKKWALSTVSILSWLAYSKLNNSYDIPTFLTSNFFIMMPGFWGFLPVVYLFVIAFCHNAIGWRTHKRQIKHLRQKPGINQLTLLTVLPTIIGRVCIKIIFSINHVIFNYYCLYYSYSLLQIAFHIRLFSQE